jgi:hypothetical protein
MRSPARQSSRVGPVAATLTLLIVVLTVPPAIPAGRAGGARPAAVIVSGGAAPDATASNNQVKIARASTGLVAAYAGTSGGIAQVFLAVSHDAGGHWSAPTQVSTGPVPSRLAALASDGQGRVHVVWTRYDSGVGKIYHRVWNGQWTGPQERISPPSGYAGYPALALDQTGLPQVVWYGIREGNGAAYTRHQSIYEIYYVGFDGRAWSPPLLISTGVPDSINPALASDRHGRLHAVWYQFNGRVFQVRYAERASGWSASEGVFRSRFDEFNPDLAVDAEGRVSLAWERHDDRLSVIEYARRSAGRWEAPTQLTDGASPAHHPSVAIAASGDIYVLWDQDDGQVYARRFAGRWMPAVRMTTEGVNTFPGASTDGVVWTHTAGTESRVYFARLPPGP